jgi:hypothetical protein
MVLILGCGAKLLVRTKNGRRGMQSLAYPLGRLSLGRLSPCTGMPAPLYDCDALLVLHCSDAPLMSPYCRLELLPKVPLETNV